jgi:LPS sulfotransferase NodH
MRHLFLLAQPRSGTNYLYQLLSNANGPFCYATLAETIFNANLFNTAICMNNLPELLGDHPEKFCVDESLQQSDGFDFEFFQQVVFQYHQTNAGNSPILVKWFPHGMKQFSAVMEKKGKKLTIPLLKNIFGEIIWIDIHRENVVKQAVSYEMAMQTKKWIQFKNWETSQTEMGEQELVYDFERLLHWVHWFQSERLFWPAWLSEMGVQSSYSMTYEKLSANYVKTLSELSEKTGLAIDIPEESQIRISPQKNEQYDIFLYRFKEDCQQKGIDTTVWENDIGCVSIS